MLIAAQYILLFLLFAILILHTLILLKVIPYNLVWGSRLKSISEMYRFEIASLLINAILFLIVLETTTLLNLNISLNILKIAFWIMAFLFSVNTIANIFSKNKIEKMLFTPITIIMALLSIYIAWSL